MDLNKKIKEELNERKILDKKVIHCCCALSAPDKTECVGPFENCADCS